MAESQQGGLIPDATYAEQEDSRFRIEARIRGIVSYRLVMFVVLPLTTIFAWPMVAQPVPFMILVVLTVAVNVIQLLLHFFDHSWADRLQFGAVVDAALYAGLAALSGFASSYFVYLFFPLILYSVVRFHRYQAWGLGLLAVGLLVLLQLLSGPETLVDSGQLGALLLGLLAVALATGEIGYLVTQSRNRAQEAVMGLVDANRRIQREQSESQERANQVQLLLDSTEEGIYGVDLEGNCTLVNPACLRMLGFERPDDVLGRNMHELIHHSWPDGRHYPKEACHVRLAVREGRSVHSEDEVHWRSDGTCFPVEYWARPIWREGELVGAVVTFVDISERLQAQEQQRRLSLALEKTDDAVSITDPDGTIRYVNPAFESVSGYSATELIGRSHKVLQSGQHEAKFFADMWETIRGGESWHDVVVNRRKDGSLYYEEKTVTPVKDDQGRIISFVSTGKDITEHREIQKRLRYLAHHDILTGLPNRAMLIDRLEHALTLAGPEHIVAVLFVDVDRFKVINDTLGHHFGDGILRSLAERLARRVSERDTVARLGGDEFAIIMEGVHATEEVATLASRLLLGLEEPFTVDDRSFVLTASIGISVAPMDGGDAAALLKQADIAMFRAKEQGRNRYQFYSTDLGAGVAHRLVLETRLREAIEQQRFELHYQPQVDLRSGQILGVEALLRLDAGKTNEVSPVQFIPILEDTGLILAVGEWVLQEACEQARRWTDLAPDLRMSVNVSGLQFGDPQWIGQIDRLLNATDLAPAQLEIEITESVAMQDDRNTAHTFAALGERGVRIAIDDFGVGYSSLGYLKRFPIDTLKIDRSFVRDLVHDRNAGTIVHTIIAMARTLELNVVAEGVETEGQVEFLRQLDCDIAQGFLFSPPESAALVEPILDGARQMRCGPLGQSG